MLAALFHPWFFAVSLLHESHSKLSFPPTKREGIRMRAGKQWGVLALLLGCLTASAKPPETPVKPVINGKV